MIKGASIALVFLILGGFLGRQFTIMHFETVAKAFVSGQESAKK